MSLSQIGVQLPEARGPSFQRGNKRGIPVDSELWEEGFQTCGPVERGGRAFQLLGWGMELRAPRGSEVGRPALECRGGSRCSCEETWAQRGKGLPRGSLGRSGTRARPPPPPDRALGRGT